MGINLYLVKKDQSIMLIPHFLAGDHTDLKIEILNGSELLEQPLPDSVLGKVQLDIVLK